MQLPGMFRAGVTKFYSYFMFYIFFPVSEYSLFDVTCPLHAVPLLLSGAPGHPEAEPSGLYYRHTARCFVKLPSLRSLLFYSDLVSKCILQLTSKSLLITTYIKSAFMI